MNQNIHLKVKCNVAQNVSTTFFAEKTQNFEVILQDKATEKSLCLLG